MMHLHSHLQSLNKTTTYGEQNKMNLKFIIFKEIPKPFSKKCHQTGEIL